MSRKVQLVLLCEDSQHEVFARRFLVKMGWPTRSLRVEKSPGGRGSAEQFVRKQFPRELKAHRLRPVEQSLVVMIDGDADGPHQRMVRLKDECRAQNVEPPRDNERVAVFVPTWNIEAWIAYLDGEEVDEAKKNYPKLPRPSNCKKQVATLAEMCKKQTLRQPAPASLLTACTEYQERLKR